MVARAVEQLKALKASGVDTLIDLTPYDVGRDIRLIEEVSRKSGMQIVACTGQHLSAPPSLVDRPTEALTDFFIQEIEQGIDGTDIKAGVIKVATANDVVTAPEERALRAAARASKATGVRIATHTHARLRGGEKQAEIFEAEGISPARVSLGHSDDSGDMDYLAGLARRGYTLGMDHINRGLKPDARVSWKTRAAHIKQLIDMGFGDRLFLSQDTVLGIAMFPPELQGEREKTNPDGLFFNSAHTDSAPEADRRVVRTNPDHDGRESATLLRARLISPSAEKALDQVRRHGGGGNAAHAATSVLAAVAGAFARPGPKPLAHVVVEPDAVHVVVERLAQRRGPGSSWSQPVGSSKASSLRAKAASPAAAAAGGCRRRSGAQADRAVRGGGEAVPERRLDAALGEQLAHPLERVDGLLLGLGREAVHEVGVHHARRRR